MEISKEEILKVLKRLIDRLEKEDFETIDVHNDWYYFIPVENWHEFNHEIHIGSLFDDINSLKILSKNDKRPCTYVDFDRIASLLRFISEKNNP